MDFNDLLQDFQSFERLIIQDTFGPKFVGPFKDEKRNDKTLLRNFEIVEPSKRNTKRNKSLWFQYSIKSLPLCMLEIFLFFRL